MLLAFVRNNGNRGKKKKLKRVGLNAILSGTKVISQRSYQFKYSSYRLHKMVAQVSDILLQHDWFVKFCGMRQTNKWFSKAIFMWSEKNYL